MEVEVLAHIAGSVWKVHKQPGDPVEAGEAVVTLESMKMEVPVEAPASGTLRALHCAEGDRVDEDALLATLDA